MDGHRVCVCAEERESEQGNIISCLLLLHEMRMATSSASSVRRMVSEQRKITMPAAGL